MYIVNIKKNGREFTRESFTDVKEYNAFIEGLVWGLEMSNLKYTYNEMLGGIPCITKTTFDIL